MNIIQPRNPFGRQDLVERVISNSKDPLQEVETWGRSSTGSQLRQRIAQRRGQAVHLPSRRASSSDTDSLSWEI